MSWSDTANRLADSAIERLGNDITIDGVAGRGILRQPSESIFDGVVIVTDYMLEVPASAWPLVEEGADITVDGKEFTAREQSRPSQDGSSVMIPLEPVK
jgi:hypothetical protein